MPEIMSPREKKGDQMVVCVYIESLKRIILDFRSRWWHRQTWLTSLHNNVKITTKIQNSHHSELSEVELSRNLTTMELKKSHPSRLVESIQIGNGLVPYHVCMERTCKNYFPSKFQVFHTSVLTIFTMLYIRPAELTHNDLPFHSC